MFFFTWNAAIKIHSQCNVTIPRDRKNANILGNDWRVRKHVTYYRISIGVAKEHLLHLRNTKQNTRDYVP